MKKIFSFLILLSLALEIQVLGRGAAGGQVESNDFFKSNEVQIGPNCIGVPMGRIILIRKGSDHGAVKFTDFWFGKTVHDWYGKYESYYQGDGSGDFSKQNVILKKGEVSTFPAVGGGGLHWSFDNPNFRWGPFKLAWSPKSKVYFSHVGEGGRGDYGIELAPTKWTDISQVNVFDHRLKWYAYDENRKDTYIPIDQLWEDGEGQK